MSSSVTETYEIRVKGTVTSVQDAQDHLNDVWEKRLQLWEERLKNGRKVCSREKSKSYDVSVVLHHPRLVCRRCLLDVWLVRRAARVSAAGLALAIHQQVFCFTSIIIVQSVTMNLDVQEPRVQVRGPRTFTETGRLIILALAEFLAAMWINDRACATHLGKTRALAFFSDLELFACCLQRCCYQL